MMYLASRSVVYTARGTRCGCRQQFGLLPELLLVGAVAPVQLLAVSTEKLDLRPLLMGSSSVESGSDAAAGGNRGSSFCKSDCSDRHSSRVADLPLQMLVREHEAAGKPLGLRVWLDVVELVCLVGDVTDEGLAVGHEWRQAPFRHATTFVRPAVRQLRAGDLK